ncbi:hypothetical protein PACTADRAFT_36871 [Pachysolen tannophilus NRRL Y-2460]|uniref:1,3-beta-glucan synthase n=1 Tax=Pachysolen tannophilus NRRL Y-2460 TaxID=669874 RepID=A0A1E4U326_PACTA|nr:hypothetical protein PACTADRAFT_36871 [Pachysolen tannophilus NRRL Y-2460]
MFDYLLKLLDSRASRMGPILALRSLHADYIGGLNSNFRKWYFASQLDIDDTIGYKNAKADGTPTKDYMRSQNITKEDVLSLQESEKRWSQNMNSLSALDCVVQIALYLLIWGEANNIRFMPECICFIFKCCNDYFYSLDFSAKIEQASPDGFLDHVITPLYEFYRDQTYDLVDGAYVRCDKDHSSTIGYDDMNQLFWYRKGLEKIVLKDRKTKFMSIPPTQRYIYMKDILWEKAFYKTFHETRTWLHLITNFNRIWIIHISVFWYYTVFNSPTLYTKNYKQALNNPPTMQATLSAISLAGSLSTFINIVATLAEYVFVPRKWPGAEPLTKKLFFLFFILILNTSPSIYIFLFRDLDDSSFECLTIAIAQFVFSLFTVIYFSITPLGGLFGISYLNRDERSFLASRYFTGSVYKLHGRNSLSSWSLWVLVFSAKFTESYFFLTLSLRDPIRELSTMQIRRCIGEVYFGSLFCSYQPWILLALMYFTDIILFFLDTYLWYIISNTLFSVCRSFYIGVSIWTPWRNIFSRLPKRIFSKIIASNSDRNIKAKYLVSQVWNSIIISMYREHLLSVDVVQRLIYQQTIETDTGEGVLKEPNFFVSQEDQFMKSSIFESQTEAQRRITFFAQSLSTPMPEATSTKSMPTFSVLIPHYSEKITLSLKEIIREEDKYSHVTLLEYLKQLHPSEWENFVQDTKALSHEIGDSATISEEDSVLKFDDLAYYCVGFKSSSPEYILRTRIWASLRSQTLYRTISGFMNYSRAIKLLFDVENPNLKDFDNSEHKKLESASIMALRKFRIIVSMQRLNEFFTAEQEDKDFILRAYPELQISYLEEEIIQETGEVNFYSCLIDGSCEITENGQRKPKYRIKLSGNPILGDGKSDNQNHSVIFCRGEYIQLIDANQDNYLEECLKIRNVLAEFEESSVPTDPYTDNNFVGNYNNPVAIIGTREYIFSENIGVLGDVAAGKEQTFGTLFARTLAHIGGKLHYGHPDFLNSVFMTTRGGVSKAQKGLHLNEDIYAGMNAMIRGGRIKHCEYMQCGKGRDLGFGSILNFTTKIGAGMGEQMLSREYFYLGTQLPVDRFLSFYYAHPGFHLNNVFILLSIKAFLLVCINMAALTHDSVICEYDKNRPITDARRPPGCLNLIPVVEWLQRCILSISMVFAISFVPLCVQELTERGIWRALTRFAKHFASCSPLFEVFVCKIYAQSLINDLAIGGARYIATGRGFATVRVPFSVLYTRFATESLYFGATAICMLIYSSISMWKPSLLYLWATIGALCISPFLFNPNQFLWCEFFLDYKNFLGWLSAGSSRYNKDNWNGYVRSTRTQLTGSKRKVKKRALEKPTPDFRKPSAFNLLLSQTIPHLIMTFFVSLAYFFANSQNDVRGSMPANTVLRILFCSFGPIALNMALLLALFIISALFGPILTFLYSGFPSLLALFAHSFSILNHVAFFEFLWLCQNWDFATSVLGLCDTILIQSLFFKLITQIFLTREMKYDSTNYAWWSGKWASAGLGWNILTQPVREYICKVIEMSMFAGDFFLCHFILFIQLPILLIPYIDRFHSLMLLWLKPGRLIRPQIFSLKQRRKRTMTVYFYSLIFLIMAILLSSIIVVPILLDKTFDISLVEYLPETLLVFVQPDTQVNPRKGLRGYRKPKYLS